MIKNIFEGLKLYVRSVYTSLNGKYNVNANYFFMKILKTEICNMYEAKFHKRFPAKVFGNVSIEKMDNYLVAKIIYVCLPKLHKEQN